MNMESSIVEAMEKLFPESCFFFQRVLNGKRERQIDLFKINHEPSCVRNSSLDIKMINLTIQIQ